MHFHLNQVFRPHVSGIFDSQHYRDGQHAACHRLLHPQDLIVEMLTRSTPRLLAIAFDAVASTRTRGFTTFAMFAAVAISPRALDAPLVSAQNSASRELVATTF